MAKLLYKPFGMIIGALGGMVAGALFKRLWALVAGESTSPSATRADQRWVDVLGAAALEGAIYALVKAAMDRSGAIVFQRVTGTWPGEEGTQ